MFSSLQKMGCRGSLSFIKFLVEDNFREEIRIPPAFTLKIREFSKKWVLKTDLFNRTWYVKVDQQGRYYYICKLSWPDFVKSHELKHGDFLIFRHVGVSTGGLSIFDVLLYSARGLPKRIGFSQSTLGKKSDNYQEPAETVILPSNSTTQKRNIQEISRYSQHEPYMRTRTSKRTKNFVQVKEEKMSDSNKELKRDKKIIKPSIAKLPYFRVVFKYSNIQRLALPADMAKKIMRKNLEVLFLVDQSGREWSVNLCPAKDGRIYMGRGWAAFRNDNNLKEGEEYTFMFIENEKSMLLVQKVEGVSEIVCPHVMRV